VTSAWLLLVRSGHHFRADAPVAGCSRTNPATPGPSRRAAGSAQLAESRCVEGRRSIPQYLRKRFTVSAVPAAANAPKMAGVRR